MMDLSVDLCGVRLKNPIIPASGTFGFGREYANFFPLETLGGIAVKGLTPRERAGNPPPRIAETPAGMLNSVGLQNPGVDAFIEKELPWLRRHDVRIIANISGSTPEEYGDMARKLSDAGVDLIELNVSCPNVRAGGIAFGVSCAAVTEVVRAAKRHASRPVLVKLSPNVTDVAEIARAAEDAGADGLTLINTLLGMRIDVKTRRPVLGNIMGGLSGPAVFPVALRMVYQVTRAVTIPVVGMGGVSTGEDAAEMLLAGATAVGVGTACIRDPLAPLRILDGLKTYMKQNGVSSVRELTGAVRTD